MKTKLIILIVIGLMIGLLLATAWHDRAFAGNPHSWTAIFSRQCWSGNFDPGWKLGMAPGMGVYQLKCYKPDGVTLVWEYNCGPMEDHAVILSETLIGRPKITCYLKPDK